MTEENVSKAIEIIRNLYEKYSDNSYMYNKTHQYICNQLPQLLENMEEAHKTKVLRTENLTTQQECFINSFLSINQYFYVPSTDKYFRYKENSYTEVLEDDILHNILTSITNANINDDGYSVCINGIRFSVNMTGIITWKYKIKVSIMKRIKENILFKSVPESETIQKVIYSLYPAFFSSKTEAKYFLTVLGDNIVKKNAHLIHFLPLYAKPFVRELNMFCQTYLGVNLSQTIKYNSHPNHDYEHCRLLYIHETAKYENCWRSVIGLDLLCVANHYSLRYDHSDKFLIRANDKELENMVFFLKDRSTVDKLVCGFIQENIEVLTDETNRTDFVSEISWKDMLYLWKGFLTRKRLPSMVYQNQLKQILTEKLKHVYDYENNVFINIFSKFLPEIQTFLNFINETMTEDEEEFGLEIEEIRELFQIWGSNKKGKLLNISSSQIVDILHYYFPELSIENDKYIHHMKCSLWDKRKDILEAKINMNDEECNLEIVSVYDEYVKYCKYHYYLREHGKTTTPIVSKTYFENVYETINIE